MSVIRGMALRTNGRGAIGGSDSEVQTPTKAIAVAALPSRLIMACPARKTGQTGFKQMTDPFTFTVRTTLSKTLLAEGCFSSFEQRRQVLLVLNSSCMAVTVDLASSLDIFIPPRFGCPFNLLPTQVPALPMKLTTWTLRGLAVHSWLCSKRSPTSWLCVWCFWQREQNPSLGSIAGCGSKMRIPKKRSGSASLTVLM